MGRMEQQGGPLRWMRRALALVCAAAALGGCRDDDGEPPPAAVDSVAAGGRVEVRLAAPDELAWNQTDTVRVVVVNATGAALTDAVLHVFLPAPLEALVDSGAAVPARTAAADGTRLAYPVAAVEPGRTVGFAQAIRTPPAASRAAAPAARPGARLAAAADTLPRVYVVRAWLETRGGQPPGAPAQDTLRIRPGSEITVGGCGNVPDATVTRYGIGPVRIGMTLEALRSACPEARDTAWRGDEGMAEQGAVVAPAGQRVLVVLAGDRVGRIVVDQPGLETPAGAGVGSTVGDLRARFGRMCAGAGEGRVAVWFPNTPGISFGLDTLATRGWAGAPPPDSIPDEVAVGSFWVRQGTDDCPARPGGGGGR